MSFGDIIESLVGTVILYVIGFFILSFVIIWYIAIAVFASIFMIIFFFGFFFMVYFFDFLPLWNKFWIESFEIFSMFSLLSVFKALALLASIMVVNTRNPIHAVLFLILVFINSAIVFIFLNAEFISLSLIVIYIGAIAVLFLFVVMVLDIRILDFKRGYMLYYPPGIILTFLIAMVSKRFFIDYFKIDYIHYICDHVDFVPQILSLSNLNFLGIALFNYYFFILFLASLILLISVIGAVILTSELSSSSNINEKQVVKYSSQIFSNFKIFYKKSLDTSK